MAVELPLFLLNAVLFPHMRMALHVFEERYRVMMRDCRTRGTTFGVLALREGLEVGDTAGIPYGVGTLAQLDEVEELDDGRYNLTIAGASRFRVVDLIFDRPYLAASVEYLQDSTAPADDVRLLHARVSEAYAAYVSALQAFGVETDDMHELPDEPELCSYVVAAALRVDTPRRQELLELDSAGERLRRGLRLLRRETALLRAMAEAQDQRRRAALLN